MRRRPLPPDSLLLSADRRQSNSRLARNGPRAACDARLRVDRSSLVCRSSQPADRALPFRNATRYPEDSASTIVHPEARILRVKLRFRSRARPDKRAVIAPSDELDVVDHRLFAGAPINAGRSRIRVTGRNTETSQDNLPTWRHQQTKCGSAALKGWLVVGEDELSAVWM